jgi:hypothetical protein
MLALPGIAMAETAGAKGANFGLSSAARSPGSTPDMECVRFPPEVN